MTVSLTQALLLLFVGFVEIVAAEVSEMPCLLADVRRWISNHRVCGA